MAIEKLYKLGYRTALLFLLQLSTWCGYAQVETPDTVYSEAPVEVSHFDEAETNPYYAHKEVPDNELRKLKEDEDYWYANLAPERKKKKAGVRNEGSSVIETLIWFIVVIGFIGVLLWYLASSDIRIFRKTPKVISEGEAEEISEDIFAIDYEKEIATSVTQQNFRLATRLYYLGILKALSDQQLISYTHEKTNSDYLFQLSGTSYYKAFFRLTREFEYTWYGKFPLSPEAFNRVQQDFIDFKNRLP